MKNVVQTKLMLKKDIVFNNLKASYVESIVADIACEAIIF